MNLKKFQKIDKVNFFRQTSDIICNEVIQSIKIEKKTRVALQRLEYLWKEEKVTMKSKQVIIRTLEEKITTLGVNPWNSAPATNILKENENEITTLKKKLKIPIIEPV